MKLLKYCILFTIYQTFYVNFCIYFQMHGVVKRELETLKKKHKVMIEELKTWRDKVSYYN